MALVYLSEAGPELIVVCKQCDEQWRGTYGDEIVSAVLDAMKHECRPKVGQSQHEFTESDR